jgi:hypothetical protein
MSTAGGGLKVGGSAWLGLKGLSTLDLVRQRASSLSRVADAIWGQFFFPPVAGPLSSNPTWIPNWVPLQVALQMPAIKRLQPGYAQHTARSNMNWFIALAQAEASGNRVWAKFRAGTNPGVGVGGRIVVQLKMVPGYYQVLQANRD